MAIATEVAMADVNRNNNAICCTALTVRKIRTSTDYLFRKITESFPYHLCP